MFKTLLLMGVASTPFVLGMATPTAGRGDSEITRSNSRAGFTGPDSVFTGEVSIQPLFDPNEIRKIGAMAVDFAPCARTAWHSHPAGQTLVVTSGTGWVQDAGGHKQRIQRGDVVWTPPGIRHWHGATDSTAMTHIAIQEYLNGRAVDWMEQVTEEDYLR
jgi:quercetin dioxygenase-like cupin family protein